METAQRTAAREQNAETADGTDGTGAEAWTRAAERLPAQLRKDLLVRAAQHGIEPWRAVRDAVAAWSGVPAQAGARVEQAFRKECEARGLTTARALPEAARMWFDANPVPPVPRARRPVRTARRIVVCNQKGGVGKTAVSSGVAQALAERGERVLLVDYDPQGHLSQQLGVAVVEDEKESLSAHMAGDAKGGLAALLTPLDCGFTGDLVLLPACMDAFLLDVRLSRVRSRENALERALSSVENEFDTVVVDCPPSLGLGMDAAIAYSRTREGEPAGRSGVLIPVQAEDASATAFTMLMDQMEDLRADLGIQLSQLGLVVNLYDARRGYIATSSLEKWQALDEPPVLAVLPDRKEQREAVRLQRPLLSYAPGSEQAQLFRELARRLG
jgi:chromosome partitioning protein